MRETQDLAKIILDLQQENEALKAEVEKLKARLDEAVNHLKKIEHNLDTDDKDGEYHYILDQIEQFLNSMNKE
jgi:regulator of replication initiation timing